MQENTPALNSSIQLPCGIVIKNRLFKSAMSEQLAEQDHNPSPQLIKLYRRWSQSEVGICMSGNLMVDRKHLGEPKNVVLDDQSDLDAFRRWALAGSENSTDFWAQLNHPGKQSPRFINKNPIAPSAIPLAPELQNNFATPHAMDDSDIASAIAKFAQSAQLAKDVGFSGVQIHAAHGYLIGQFLSGKHNQRQDKWGGTLANRSRFLMEVYHAIRAKVGTSYPVGVKLNSADFSDGGFNQEDSIQVVQQLSEAGVDLIEVSGGSYEVTAMADGVEKKQSTLSREAYFLEFAEECKKNITTPLVVTGGFRTSKGMRQALQSKATDFIGVARPMALDPDFPKHVIAQEEFALELPHVTTGIKALDKMVLLNMSWYEVQLARIGQGKLPEPKLNAWVATLKILWGVGVFAFKSRRA